MKFVILVLINEALDIFLRNNRIVCLHVFTIHWYRLLDGDGLIVDRPYPIFVVLVTFMTNRCAREKAVVYLLLIENSLYIRGSMLTIGSGVR